jgi:hypothetical protein
LASAFGAPPAGRPALMALPYQFRGLFTLLAS